MDNSNNAVPASAINLKIYKPEVRARLLSYVNNAGINKTKAINEILTAVFEIEPHFSDDVISNLNELQTLLNSIDWAGLRGVHDDLKGKPLTQNTTLTNLLVAIINNGVNHQQSTLEKLGGS